MSVCRLFIERESQRGAREECHETMMCIDSQSPHERCTHTPTLPARTSPARALAPCAGITPYRALATCSRPPTFHTTSRGSIAGRDEQETNMTNMIPLRYRFLVSSPAIYQARASSRSAGRALSSALCKRCRARTAWWLPLPHPGARAPDPPCRVGTPAQSPPCLSPAGSSCVHTTRAFSADGIGKP